MTTVLIQMDCKCGKALKVDVPFVEGVGHFEEGASRCPACGGIIGPFPNHPVAISASGSIEGQRSLTRSQ